MSGAGSQPVAQRQPLPGAQTLSASALALIFLAFAFAYFLSALLRAVTATLAPVFSAELGLRAADLGLLAGAYFFGFAAMQLPLGRALDRWGPQRTLLVLMALAVLGCAAFALAPSLTAAILARTLIGAGVAACLMAPLTCFRSLLTPAQQLRANSWMLMTGSLGMLASTLPVQWLLPALGWRGLFWLLAGLLLLAMAGVRWLTPRDGSPRAAMSVAQASGSVPGRAFAADATATDAGGASGAAGSHRAQGADRAATADGGYASIVRHPLFVRTAPLGFFLYGGLIAVQALWAGPWLTQVSGHSADQAAHGLFVINLAMLLAFGAWGLVMPRLARMGVDPMRLMRWGLPLPLLLLLAIAWLGGQATAWHWALWCVCCTFVSVSQPAVGAAFDVARAGRALSAFNLVIFSGVFSIQWGIGMAVDAMRGWGLSEPDAFRTAMAGFGLCCCAAYAWFCARAEPVSR